MERDTITTQNRVTVRWQIFGFILVAALIAVGCACIWTGHEKVAAVIFGTTISGVAVIFVIGRTAQKRNLDKKAPR